MSVLLAADETAPGLDGLELVGDNNQGSTHCVDVEIVGDRAYVASGISAGIEIYDISDPAEMTLIRALGPTCSHLRAYGDTLYAFCHQYGLHIYDISGAITPIGHYYLQGDDLYYENGALVDGRMYTAAHQNGIHVVNVSDPADIYLESTISLGEDAAWAVERVGDHLLVGNGRHGLVVVDISGVPMVTARLALPGLANDVILDGTGTVAIVALGAGGLATVDVLDPDQPILLDIAETAGACFGIGRMDHLIATGSTVRLELFDVSDPAAIELVGFDDTAHSSLGADIEDDGAGGIVVNADWMGVTAYRVRPDVGADIELHPSRVDFGAVGASVDTTVAVLNRGSTDLEVDLEAPPGFTVAPSSFVLGAGQRIDLTVVALGAEPGDSLVRILSNDPEESAIDLFLHKNSTTFPRIGSVAPDFTLEGTDGQWHTLSDLRGQVVYLDFGSFL